MVGLAIADKGAPHRGSRRPLCLDLAPFRGLTPLADGCWLPQARTGGSAVSRDSREPIARHGNSMVACKR